MSDWDEVRAFGELRSLLNGRVREEGAARLWAMFERAEEMCPGVVERSWIDYARPFVSRWPARWCAPEVDSVEALERLGALPWLSLFRGVRVGRRVDLMGSEVRSWLTGGLAERGATLEHLEFVGCHGFYPEFFEGMFREGLLEGVRALWLEDLLMVDGMYACLFEVLDRSPSVTELSLSHVDVGRDAIGELLFTGVPERLEVLRIRNSSGMARRKALETLCRISSRFVSLRRLELYECSISSARARVLAAGDWPSTLELLDVRRNPIGFEGWKALVDAGYLGRMGASERPDALTLTDVTQKGIERVAVSEELETFTRLELARSGATSLEPLLDGGHMGRVRELSIGGERALEEDALEAFLSRLSELPELVELELDVGISPASLRRALGSGGLDGLEVLVLREGGFSVPVFEVVCQWFATGVDVRVELGILTSKRRARTLSYAYPFVRVEFLEHYLHWGEDACFKCSIDEAWRRSGGSNDELFEGLE